jgi:hypothetical protein
LKELDTKLKTINPATEAILKEYNIMTKEQIDAKVKTSRNEFSGGEMTSTTCGLALCFCE